jgi:hypothetical protein
MVHLLYSSESIDVKTGAPDAPDFATTWLYFPDCGILAKSVGILRSDCCGMAMAAQLLRELPTLAILFFGRTAKCLESIYHSSGSSPQYHFH